jgi:hypothetical protein
MASVTRYGPLNGLPQPATASRTGETLPHLPHPGPLGTLPQVLLLVEYPEVVGCVTTAFRKRPYMVDVVLFGVKRFAFQIPLYDRPSCGSWDVA